MQVQYRRIAEQHIEDTYRYYLYQAGLIHAKSFLSNLYRMEKRLEEFPLSCQIYKVINRIEIRRGVMSNFPHLLFYTVNEEEDRIEVIGLFHSKQNIVKLLKI